MWLDPRAFEKAASVQRSFEHRFASDPDVVGIGLGVNGAADAPVLNVQVRTEAARRRLPSTFEQLGVVVEVVGDLHAL